MPVTNEELAFAEERLKLHEDSPDEGMSLHDLKKYFADKYGFELKIKPIAFVDSEEAIEYYEKKLKD